MSVRTDLDHLALDLDGELALPGDPSWDEVRQAWNLAVDQQPVAVATVTSVRDVQTVVTAARRCGLRVAAQSTGHNASPMGRLADTILLRLAKMRGVSVDPSTRVARAEGGVNRPESVGGCGVSWVPRGADFLDSGAALSTGGRDGTTGIPG